MDETKWQAIPGHPGYEAHPDGFISSLRRGARVVLRAAKQSSGYLSVSLSLGARKQARSFCVHRLILETFVGPCPPGSQARHLDGDRSNNRLENLAWGTARENAADRTRHGTENVGERNGRARLTDPQIAAIRASTETNLVLARRYGLHKDYVWQIRHGRYRVIGEVNRVAKKDR